MSINEQITILKKETRRRMGSIAMTVLLITLVILALGLLWNEKYESSTTILVEEQKIIAPLLQGATVPTGVRDQAELAREVIYSRDVMSQVVEEAGWLPANATPIEQAEVIEQVKEKIEVINVGDNLIQISVKDTSPQRAFKTVLTLSEMFISRARAAKYEESRSAYQFISAEAERYREKLQESEQRLQRFLAENGNVKPGASEMLDTRESELLRRMQGTALDLEEARVRVRSLEAQLSNESSTTAVITREEQIRSMIAQLQSQLETLLLQYTESYPDVISTRHKIDDLREQLARVQEQRANGTLPDDGTGGDGIALNPLHQELRAELSKARTQVAALEERLARNSQWLEEARERGVEVSDVEAEAAELTRDYEVTKNIYEDLLERRESARIAMNMDEQGEGLSMSIQEPPTVPLQPSGLRFMHFALLAPFLATGMALAGVFARVRFDDRIRTGTTISRDLHIPVLATVPVLMDNGARMRQRRTKGAVFAAVVMLLASYALIAALRMNDFL